MAHFAEIDDNNVVLRVIVVDNDNIRDVEGNESEAKGIVFCNELLGGKWVQTSYNAKFRKNYAGIGDTYDKVRDAFIQPKPFSSWILNEETCRWQAPVSRPVDTENPYIWNEEEGEWVIYTPSS
jgi:hypothetical protein